MTMAMCVLQVRLMMLIVAALVGSFKMLITMALAMPMISAQVLMTTLTPMEMVFPMAVITALP